MANEKIPQKTSGANTPKNKSIDAPVVPSVPSSSSAPASSSTSRAKSTSKQRKSNAQRSRIGGTAVAGAKSTVSRPTTPSGNPQQQQMESYNREMRRRMERLGTGPQSESERAEAMQKKRNKRVERRKERLDERREEARKRLPTSRPGLGRRNTYFIIAVVAVLVILIVVFALIRLGIL